MASGRDLMQSIAIAVLALLAPILYGRFHLIEQVYYNAPHRLPKINSFKSHEIKFTDRLRSCEDALLIESQHAVILPCDPGRERWNSVMGIFQPGPVPSGDLFVYHYGRPEGSDIDALERIELVNYEPGDDFHSLGVAFHEPTSTLFVANNRHDGPHVDLFKLDLKASTATHIRSIQHPFIHGPNSIVLVSESEFYVTNDHYFLMINGRLLSLLETYLSFPLGTVVHVDISDPETVSANVVARVPFANGIEFVNDTTLAVAATSRSAVYLYDVVHVNTTSSIPSLTYKSKIQLPFSVDNLSVSKDGRLLMAGHPHPPSLTKFATTRHVCNDAAELANSDAGVKEYCRTGTTASWVSQWTEETGLKHLYADIEYPSSSTATIDSEMGVGFITGLYAKGILMWRE
ncbi:putative paraoxonase [Xylariales sp. PMI_506]|nr:putative paraoxonase [Xylariales sp. PMI_506]